MVKIRLKRIGRKKKPVYRIVVTDVNNRRDGAPIEELGFYNPLSKLLKLDKDKAAAWISKGAQPTDTVKRLIGMAGALGEVITLAIPAKEKLSKKQQDIIKKQKAAEAAALAEKASKTTEPPAEAA
jgi:small subunit ribosomal protein S16